MNEPNYKVRYTTTCKLYFDYIGWQLDDLNGWGMVTGICIGSALAFCLCAHFWFALPPLIGTLFVSCKSISLLTALKSAHATGIALLDQERNEKV